MALALQREPNAYRSQLMVAGAVLPPEPMLARLIRGCIALAFTATVPADQSSQRHADTVKRVASSAALHWRCNASQMRTDRY